jgi:hypothetical protein
MQIGGWLVYLKCQQFRHRDALTLSCRSLIENADLFFVLLNLTVEDFTKFPHCHLRRLNPIFRPLSSCLATNVSDGHDGVI